MNKNHPSSVLAVIVTFESDINILELQVESLRKQVDSICIVDNLSTNAASLQALTDNNITLICLDNNYGIAYAQNVGIELAIHLSCSHVLLMDQDSLPSPDMVEHLLRVLLKVGDSAAAAGPSYEDRRNNRKSFFVIEKSGLPSRWYPNSTQLPDHIEANFLIASGSLISTSALLRIRGKRSNYFIDHVDTEWSFRARAKGYVLLGVPQAVMQHTLGDEVREVWFFGRRQVSYHSPLRDYYMFRNTLLLLGDVPMKLVWRLHFLYRLCQFAVYFLIFSTHRCARLKMMLLGLYHGIKRQSGKLDTADFHCLPIPSLKIEPESQQS